MKQFLRSLALAAGMLFALTGLAQNKVNIFVATGPTTGVYYPMGGGLADVLTKYVPNLNATAGTTDGAMANLLLIGQSKADIPGGPQQAEEDRPGLPNLHQGEQGP